MTAHTAKTTRMSIDVGLKDHKRIKMLAAVEKFSIREFVMECIAEKDISRKSKKTQ